MAGSYYFKLFHMFIEMTKNVEPDTERELDFLYKEMHSIRFGGLRPKDVMRRLKVVKKSIVHCKPQFEDLSRDIRKKLL